jgi:hypothetical protein
VSGELNRLICVVLYQLPEKQFIWTAVSARAKVKAWRDVEQLLTGKVSFRSFHRCFWFAKGSCNVVYSFKVGIIWPSLL